MEPQELFRMILSVDSIDRKLAEGLIDSLIKENEYLNLTQLHILLVKYENYPGYDVVVDKERIEEKIEEYIERIKSHGNQQ
jgi:hypothetical protein